MTADRTIDELIAWMEYRDNDETAWSIRHSGDDQEKSFPQVTLECTDATEHEVLRGVYAMQIEARIESLPHEDGGDASATDLATHKALGERAYKFLGDSAAIEWIDTRGSVRVFDVRGFEPKLEPEDDKRVTTFTLTVTACISTP